MLRASDALCGGTSGMSRCLVVHSWRAAVLAAALVLECKSNPSQHKVPELSARFEGVNCADVQ